MALDFNDSQNKDVINNIIDTLKLNPVTDLIPRRVVPSIQPVFEVYAPVAFVKSATATNSTVATIYTTPSNKDFYLCSAQCSVQKDVLSTSDLTHITVIIDGTSVSTANIVGLGLTIESGTASMTFPVPVKVDRNTIIAIKNSVGDGSVRATGSISGFLKETGNNLSV